MTLLDEGGIRRAVLLSTAYWFASSRMPSAGGVEYEHVRAENDWTSSQAARFPSRLVAFCSVNPLRDYAADEIRRCAASGAVKGVKLHNGNSDVDLRNPAHVDRLRAAVRVANEHRLAIVIHLWSGSDYGREHAAVFLREVLPEARDVTVQIAHFAGAGPGYTDSALKVFADAIAVGDPATDRLYFDVAGVANFQPPAVLAAFAARIREVGLRRVLFGTDVGSPRENWAIFRTTVPLTDDEFAAIARNVAPYFD
jgi:predicted TIM-barrel fold metal-dependent hydrolase